LSLVKSQVQSNKWMLSINPAKTQKSHLFVWFSFGHFIETNF